MGNLGFIFLTPIFLPAFFVRNPSAKKQVFTPFSVEQPWLRLAPNPSRSLLPFKLNSHLKNSLKARVKHLSSN